MTSCTIIISHYESLPFLHACIRQIRKYNHPEIEQIIMVADQSSPEYSVNVYNEFRGESDINGYNLKPLYSGFGIDWLIRNGDIKTDYICQLHVDAFPIHKNWLYLPIKLIEEINFSFVGQLQFISKPTDTIYPPSGGFFAMAQCFNVAKTETYKELSLEAGFTRFHNRIDSGLTFKNDDWLAWANEDYYNRGSDDDVVAFHWEDTHRKHDKLGLAITGMIAAPYGRIIEDIVFHFGSCRESIGVSMGVEYNSFTDRINAGYDDNLINEMVRLAQANKPAGNSPILTRNYWNGKIKESSPTSDELNKRIEELKSDFKSKEL